MATYSTPNTQQTVESVEARQIFINDISGETTTSDLRNLFSAAGKVTNVEIDTNELNRHFAFVTFESSQGVREAITKFTTTQLKNTTLVCRKRTELEEMRQKRMIEARCKLFVGNIPQQMPSHELRREIERLSQRRIADFRHKKGYCFVGYSTPQDAEDAKRNLKSAMCGGKSLNAEFKKEDPIRNEPGFIAVLEQAQRTLYVRDVPPNCNPDYFKSVFEKYGKVRKFTLPTENRSNKLVGYAFIEYFWKEDCDKALAETENIQIDGVNIEIRISDPPKDKTSKKDDDRDNNNNHRRGGGGGRRDRRDNHRGMNRDRRNDRRDRRNSRFSRDNRNRSRSRSRSRSRDRRYNANQYNGNHQSSPYDLHHNQHTNPYMAHQPNPYNRYAPPIPQQPAYIPPPATVYNARNPAAIYNPYGVGVGVVDPNAATNNAAAAAAAAAVAASAAATTNTQATTATTAATNTAIPQPPTVTATAYNPNPYGYNYAAYGYPYGVQPQAQAQQQQTTPSTATTTNTTTTANTTNIPSTIPQTQPQTSQPQTAPNGAIPQQQTYAQYNAQQANYYAAHAQQQQQRVNANADASVTASTTNATTTPTTNQPTTTTAQQQNASAAYNYYNNVQPNAYAASYYQQQVANAANAQQPTQPNYTYPQQNYPYNANRY